MAAKTCKECGDGYLISHKIFESSTRSELCPSCFMSFRAKQLELRKQFEREKAGTFMIAG